MKNRDVSGRVAVIGGGPAGLMAAEVLLAGGADVDLYDAMPTVGRKFLMAGKGGLNITHSEADELFLTRYGRYRPQIEGILTGFGPGALRAWVHDLGIDTFVGSSGRVFPAEMKAAPLLRAWLRRLRQSGLKLHMRHRWNGWEGRNPHDLQFKTPTGQVSVRADAVVLALGGGSWPHLGSDGAWIDSLRACDIALTELSPANCGFDVKWSPHFQERFAGAPVKSVVAQFTQPDGRTTRRKGEFIVSTSGVEGGLIYALSADVREEIGRLGRAIVHLDLAPGRDEARLIQDLSRPRGKNSLANYLRKFTGLEGVKAGLLREILTPDEINSPRRLAAAIKLLPLTLIAPRPLAEAISTAGGVMFRGLDDNLMLRAMPGIFCGGEMLDWEAPTGGYLLTACFATGRRAGLGALAWLENGGRAAAANA